MPDLIRPPVLRPRDRVGLIAPSTIVADPADIATAERTARYFGLRPELGTTIGRRYGSHEESIQVRVDDIHRFFQDPDIRGVFAVSGGYGASHLLDRLDYNLIRDNPKIFLGYSDITALHLAILQKSGMVTFHGPVLLSSLSGYTVQGLRRALFEPQPLRAIANPVETNQLRPKHVIRTIHPGKASGRLTGGNLSLIAATMGTPFEIETTDRILLLEDVGEQPYTVDRMLSQLRLAGKLEAANGVVLGECSDCVPRDFKPSRASVYSYGEIVDNLLRPLNKPAFTGLTFGHTPDQITLPLGVMAEMDATAETLVLTEAGTTRRSG